MSLFDPNNLDAFREDQTVEYQLQGKLFRFSTTWGIFSPKQIDEGSHLLLQHLSVAEDETCLDLGCGYGPLGICIAAQAPNGQVTMVDRDFISVEYCQKNIQLNSLDNAKAQLSNGFNHLPDDQKFSLIVSNLPAKVGNEMMSLFLHDAKQHLAPDGRLVVVHIGGLKNFIKRGFKEVFGNYKKVKQGKIYTVAMAIQSE